jgi:putative transposase
MARMPRITVPAYPHHIIQRGNNRAATFFAEDDYRFFLECLRQAKIKCRCRIYAYVLMTNHFHLLVEPAEIGDLGRFMQSVGRRYVRYVNGTYHRTGTLWEGRFKSAAVSRDEYLITCSRYIELNPVRAGMAAHPRDYRWSSYQRRALGMPDRLLDEDPWYEGLGTTATERQESYRAWMDFRFDEREWDEIRHATQRGRLIGQETFQKQVEAMTGRRLVGEARGRPKKKPEISVEKVL